MKRTPKHPLTFKADMDKTTDHSINNSSVEHSWTEGYRQGYADGFKNALNCGTIWAPSSESRGENKHAKNLVSSADCDFLDVFQVAGKLNVSPSQVRSYIKNRVLRRVFLPDPNCRGHKLRRVLIDKEELNRFKSQCQEPE